MKQLKLNKIIETNETHFSHFHRQGKGVSLGEIKQVGSGGFAAAPSQTLYQTDVTHSAGVDHKFNAKPRAFGAQNVGAVTVSSGVTSKKFDPAEYAKRK